MDQQQFEAIGAWLVNPEAPCAGGSLYRSRMKAIPENGAESRSEEFDDILKAFSVFDRKVLKEDKLP